MSAPATSTPVVWHDVECGSYAADLPLWRELAAERRHEGPILEVGCGTGRVALDLARAGHPVRGIDTDAALVGELNRRAEAAGLPARAERRDVRELAGLPAPHELVLAPMQVIQLLGDPAERARALAGIAAMLAPGGLAAIALVDPSPDAAFDRAAESPLPDVAEHDGWVYSSLPLEAELEPGAIRLRRLRQTVSPAGELAEEVDLIRLARLGPAELEREAARCGLRSAGRRDVPATDAHVGSAVVLLEAAP